MRTVVTFESGSGRGVSRPVSPPRRDYGRYLAFRPGPTEHLLVVGYRPPDGPEPGVWIGWLERKVRFPGALLGGYKRGIGVEAAEAIHTALSASPRIARVRWHHPDDFDAGREENGAPEPTAP
jgi:hypothetical protein